MALPITKKYPKKAKTMAQVDEQKNPKPASQMEDKLTRLMRHYLWGTQDMDTRRLRKNGWNDVVNAYMSKLPPNWPYNSIVTVPLIRTTILEKTGRLLNSKLQGRLIPRNEQGDYVKAEINNLLLDFQWDAAAEGGSMFEKCALADQYCRVFGAAFVLNYWDTSKNSNEIKVIDPRDVFFDGAANHVKNCKWIQIREFTTADKLEQRGYKMAEVRKMEENAELPPQRRDTSYESIVKANRMLVDRTGEIDDLQNPVLEIVTEWGFDRKQVPYCTIFLPKFSMIVEDKAGDKYPYKHDKLPISMLRYYPLLDDIYGESEVEGVLPLQRAANSIVDGFLDEANIMLRPPLKIAAEGVRIETIEYGPGAKWIMNSVDLVEEHTGGGGFIGTFNSVYPMIISAFNTAMGDQSLGIAQNVSSNQSPAFGNKTATEVNDIKAQQNTRDQYNQSYLAEFLKDIMMMWLENNKQFLFDDPTKKNFILKIIGKDNIQNLQSMDLDGMDIPKYALDQLSSTIMSHPGAISDEDLQGIVKDVSLPSNPVVLNPNDKPEDYDIQKKLMVSKNGEEASLYITPEDFEGEYDYIPDVKSMSAGAGQILKDARQNALQMALNPEVVQLLQTQGDTIKIKELLIGAFEDAGYKDAESLFKTNEPTQQGGQGTIGASGVPNQSNPTAGMGNTAPVSNQTVPAGLPPTQGLQGLQPNAPQLYSSAG